MLPEVVTASEALGLHHLRAIAVTTAQRSPAAPTLPTISEAGVPSYEAEIWSGLSVPAGVSKEIIFAAAHRDAKVLQAPDVIKQLDQSGIPSAH